MRFGRLPALRWALLGLLALWMPAAACNAEAPRRIGAAQPAASRIQVVTTLYPLEYFAKRIGGDDVEVVNLVPPGVEAHDFEPTPADIRRLDAARVVIYNGSGLELWMERALEAIDSDGQEVVEASGGLADLAAADDPDAIGAADPHVWLDPLKAAEQAKRVRDGLSRANPAGADLYAVNAATLLAALDQLHGRYQAGLSDCRLRTFVTTHAAFAYLARRYGLEEVSLSGVSPEAEPTAGDLAAIADRVRALGVRHVMIEANLSATLAETLANEVGANVLSLHPLESLTPIESGRDETYFSIMDANLRSLRIALECN